MRFMLDTNIVSFAMRSRPPTVLDRLRSVRPDQTCISAVTHAELRFGAARSAARSRYDALIDTFVARVSILPFDAQAGVKYAEVRAALEAAGSPIGDLDTLIASHALACGCVLVTNNVREFARVPGLVVEDWTAPT
jgi:tRNA(fMet)-specific endonuclease VapC